MLTECGAGIALVGNMKRGQEPSAVRLSLVANYLNVSTDYLLGITDTPTPAGREKTADEALNEYATKEGLSDESLHELKKYAELLRIKEMQQYNAEFADELFSKGWKSR